MFISGQMTRSIRAAAFRTLNSDGGIFLLISAVIISIVIDYALCRYAPLLLGGVLVYGGIQTPEHGHGFCSGQDPLQPRKDDTPDEIDHRTGEKNYNSACY